MIRAAARIGLAIVLLVAACAILAPAIAPYDPARSSLDSLQGPSAAHWLGTDELGRDMLSRVIYGARTSLLVGAGAAFVSLLIGAPVGLFAGYLGGGADRLAVPVIDLFIAMPGLVLALIITVMVGPSLPNLVIVLGLVMWPSVARLVRGQTLAVREMAFIEAAVVAGGSAGWIIRRHIWPNVARVVAAQFALTVSLAIITSASLSFLGLGIPPPTPDWGSMVRSGYDYIGVNPVMSLAPGAAIAFTVLGFYLLGSSVE
ncbi:MAG TPA: ABC transporter permease [Stellaceae bacterium]|nr:ABC transporter permease [Stellaceae bacterium]